MSAIMIFTSINSSGYILYNLPYLLLYPTYDCKGVLSKDDCTPENFCPMDDLDPQIIWDSEKSLHNWIEKFDLKCASHVVEASFAMCLFAGWTIGSFFVP